MATPARRLQWHSCESSRAAGLRRLPHARSAIPRSATLSAARQVTPTRIQWCVCTPPGTKNTRAAQSNAAAGIALATAAMRSILVHRDATSGCSAHRPLGRPRREFAARGAAPRACAPACLRRRPAAVLFRAAPSRVAAHPGAAGSALDAGPSKRACAIDAAGIPAASGPGAADVSGRRRPRGARKAGL